jgi:hypothetical protein
MVADFISIYDSNLELRNDINLMNDKDLNPMTFGLKIATHPTMKPTSSCKMRKGKKMRVAFGDQREETFRFREEDVEYNFEITSSFLTKLKNNYSEEKEGNTYVFRNIPSTYIIDYLNTYKNVPFNDFNKSEQWKNYIEESNKINELKNWTIVLSSIEKKDSKETTIAGFTIKKASRKKYNVNPLYTRVIADPRDFRYYFKADDQNRIKYSNGYRKGDEELQRLFNPIDGLLAIYVADVVDEKGSIVKNDVVGFGIWFPKSSRETTTDYYVNSVFTKPENVVEDKEI